MAKLRTNDGFRQRLRTCFGPTWQFCSGGPCPKSGTDDQTTMPGAKTSGLIRPSMVGPALENGATVEGFIRFLE
ncbi:hypothetical protein KC19_7G052500 [Ceratodon purpureus]|uniref:Uncharacterized protein n=1 Tax=Ceratodon purpureus TaxID=3225 RepID=A0A8T0H6E5_CERPU|nr:hypothetical protein KC19_7G052500 [Ceratodon purpureus]